MPVMSCSCWTATAVFGRGGAAAGSRRDGPAPPAERFSTWRIDLARHSLRAFAAGFGTISPETRSPTASWPRGTVNELSGM